MSSGPTHRGEASSDLSGKTSLLQAWAERSAGARRVAFVSVERDEQDAQRFWASMLKGVPPPAGTGADRDPR